MYNTHIPPHTHTHKYKFWELISQVQINVIFFFFCHVHKINLRIEPGETDLVLRCVSKLSFCFTSVCLVLRVDFRRRPRFRVSTSLIEEI